MPFLLTSTAFATPLKETLVYPLQVQWSSFAEYLLNTKALGGGPCTFVMDSNSNLYTEDNNHDVVQVNQKGIVVNTFANPDHKHRLTDLLLSGSKLFVGRADEPNILVFDTKTGKIVKTFSLLDYKETNADKPNITRRPENDPIKPEFCIQRFGLDKDKVLHIIYLATYEGRVRCYEQKFNKSYNSLGVPQEVDIMLTTGYLTSSGSWVYIRDGRRKVTGTEDYLSQYSLLGKDSYHKDVSYNSLDSLYNPQKHQSGSVFQLVGVDSRGNIYATVISSSDTSDICSVDLVVWNAVNRVPRRVGSLKWHADLLLYGLEQRHVIIANDRCYQLQLVNLPKVEQESIRYNLVEINTRPN